MTTNNLIVVGIVLALLSILSFMLLKLSSKEYPETNETIDPKLNTGSKFQPGNITFSHCTPEAEKPKRRYKRRNKKKKPATAENATVEKKSVGRPRKNQ
jgi:hypothetical protein